MTKYHFIGIGGIGMSGLVRILLSQKMQISGSDIAVNYVTEELIKEGAQVHQGHSAQHIAPGMTVVYSSDIKKDNPEYQEAIRLNCSLLHRSDILQQLMTKQKGLAVAGTHGKTTTTSLLTTVLLHVGLNPGYVVGGVLAHSQSNAAPGTGEYLVAEADESDGTFLKYAPYGAIVTNIDRDHMNHFKTDETLIHAFKQFMSQVKSTEHLLWCGDDPHLKALHPPGISYGFGTHCQLKGSHFRQKGWNVLFDADFKGKHYADIEVPLSGKHNALNALAVFGLALQLGVPEAKIRAGLQSFKGVGRRCEKKGEINGILLLDDYAHHPTEIGVTLKGVRQAVGERRIVAVFQPHRYSRMQYCLGTFEKAFDAADEVIITDLYTAGEAPISGVTTEKIIEEIENDHHSCTYIPRQQLAETLTQVLRPHDVVVTLGAGDITKLANELKEAFGKRAAKKLKVGVICGGKSLEHEISLRSVRHIHDSLRDEFYEVSLFGISKEGTWLSGPDVVNELERISKERYKLEQKTQISPHIIEELLTCDVLFPVLHGPNGEDGTIQGFFEMLGKPYAGPDYRSAAITMDKALTKKLMVMHDIATSPFVDFSVYQWKTDPEMLLKKINSSLQYPLYVKPVHLGSTVGITRVEKEADLSAAIEKAFAVDTWVLVENGLVGREIEFAVLGSDALRIFPPGEIPSHGSVYDYEAKYGPQGLKAIPKAELPESAIQNGIQFVERAYRAAGCHGMARVDCFLDKNGKYWLNEINPIPGFTSISLYPQMCAVNGIPGPDLIDALIILGLYDHRKKMKVSNIHKLKKYVHA